MPILVPCPGCKVTLRAPDAAAGRELRCPRCQTAVVLPAAEPVPSEPHEPATAVAGADAGAALRGVQVHRRHAGAAAGFVVDGLTSFQGAVAGMVAVLVGVVVDLGSGYAEAGRRLVMFTRRGENRVRKST